MDLFLFETIWYDRSQLRRIQSIDGEGRQNSLINTLTVADRLRGGPPKNACPRFFPQSSRGRGRVPLCAQPGYCRVTAEAGGGGEE